MVLTQTLVIMSHSTPPTLFPSLSSQTLFCPLGYSGWGANAFQGTYAQFFFKVGLSIFQGFFFQALRKPMPNFFFQGFSGYFFRPREGSTHFFPLALFRLQGLWYSRLQTSRTYARFWGAGLTFFLDLGRPHSTFFCVLSYLNLCHAVAELLPRWSALQIVAGSSLAWATD